MQKILGTTTNDPSDLYLARAQEQVNLHVERYAAGQPHQERLFDWPREMGAFIRTAEGFRPEDEGSEVVDQSFTVGLGDKEGVSELREGRFESAHQPDADGLASLFPTFVF